MTNDTFLFQILLEKANSVLKVKCYVLNNCLNPCLGVEGSVTQSTTGKKPT